jgi:hypothetical protein
MSLKELKQYLAQHNQKDWLKYVRMNSGEFRFISLGTMQQHSTVVSEGETAVSAGTIQVYPNRWCYEGYGSSTLDLLSLSSDECLLTEMLDRPCSRFD